VWYEVVKRIHIGYMRVKEFLGLVKFEVLPIDRETALRTLRGEVCTSNVGEDRARESE